MRKIRVLLILGIWVAILPYLGFPYSWKDVILSVCGLALVYISFMFYREKKASEVNEGNFENFAENTEFSKNI